MGFFSQDTRHGVSYHDELDEAKFSLSLMHTLKQRMGITDDDIRKEEQRIHELQKRVDCSVVDTGPAVEINIPAFLKKQYP